MKFNKQIYLSFNLEDELIFSNPKLQVFIEKNLNEIIKKF